MVNGKVELVQAICSATYVFKIDEAGQRPGQDYKLRLRIHTHLLAVALVGLIFHLFW